MHWNGKRKPWLESTGTDNSHFVELWNVPTVYEMMDGTKLCGSGLNVAEKQCELAAKSVLPSSRKYGGSFDDSDEVASFITSIARRFVRVAFGLFW